MGDVNIFLSPELKKCYSIFSGLLQLFMMLSSSEALWTTRTDLLYRAGGRTNIGRSMKTFHWVPSKETYCFSCNHVTSRTLYVPPRHSSIGPHHFQSQVSRVSSPPLITTVLIDIIHYLRWYKVGLPLQEVVYLFIKVDRISKGIL